MRSGFADGTYDVRCCSAGGYAYECVIGSRLELLQVSPSLGCHILGILHRITQGGIASCYKSAHQCGWHTEGRRQLAGIQHTQPAAGACSDVEHTSAALHPLLCFHHQSFYLRQSFLHCIGHLVVFPVDVLKQFSHRFALQMVIKRGLFRYFVFLSHRNENIILSLHHTAPVLCPQTGFAVPGTYWLCAG